MNSSSNSNTGLLVGIIGITVALFGGLVFLLTRLPSDTPGVGGDENVTFSDAADPAVGLVNAPVTVRMYEDFECPACAASHPVVKRVIETYKDRIRFVWKDFPLETIHKTARPSANAARCAQQQNKFWEYQELLFQSRDWVTAVNKKETFINLAKSVVGLNQEQFKTCVERDAADGAVATTISEGFRNRVDATPTFFVNQKRQFAMGFADWKNVLDAALAASSSTTK